MNESASPRRAPGAHAPLLIAVAVVFLVFLVVLLGLWQGLQATQRAQEELRAENEGLRDALAASRDEVAELQAGAEAVPAPREGRAPGTQDEVPLSRLPEPEPAANPLSLGAVDVEETPGGLAATMEFTPGTADPIGVFALVVRLPRDAEAAILSLEPAGGARLTNATWRVAENGRFAVYNAEAAEVAPIRFRLEVSGPATATVRGTGDLPAFDLEIGPGGPVVKPL